MLGFPTSIAQHPFGSSRESYRIKRNHGPAKARQQRRKEYNPWIPTTKIYADIIFFLILHLVLGGSCHYTLSVVYKNGRNLSQGPQNVRWPQMNAKLLRLNVGKLNKVCYVCGKADSMCSNPSLPHSDCFPPSRLGKSHTGSQVVKSGGTVHDHWVIF